MYFWLVFAGALVVRIVYIFQADASPLFEQPVVDGETYVQHAQALAAGNWLGLGQGPFWQPPLYPYVLGVVKSLFPASFFYGVRWLQISLGALSCALVFVLGRRYFGTPTGLVAGAAAALYGPLVFFDGEILPTTLGVFFNLVGLLLLERAWQRQAWWGFGLAGLVLGLGSLAVATLLSFVVAVAVWTLWQTWRQRRGWGAKALAAFVLGVVLAIAPVTWRNYAIGADQVLISYNGGINFYIGNNSAYQQTFGIRPGWEWEDLVSLPLAAGVEKPSEKSAFFFTKAKDYILGQPLDYLGLLARKTLAFCRGDEVGRNQGIYYWRHYSGLLAALLWKWGLAFPFGLVGPLAIVGLGLALRQRGLGLAALFVLVYSGAIIAFFPAARYRVAVVPVLLVFAAWAGVWLWTRFRSGQKKQGRLLVAILAVLLLMANVGVGPMDMEGDAAIHYNLGQAYARQRQAPLAEAKYAQSVALDSTYWQAWVNLGSMLAVQGKMAESIEAFEKVTRAVPRRHEVWINLAHAHMGLRQPSQAVAAYEQALEINPYLPRIYAELMQLHFGRGATDQAKKVLEKALEYYPKDYDKLWDLFRNMQRQYRRGNN